MLKGQKYFTIYEESKKHPFAHRAHRSNNDVELILTSPGHEKIKMFVCDNFM